MSESFCRDLMTEKGGENCVDVEYFILTSFIYDFELFERSQKFSSH